MVLMASGSHSSPKSLSRSSKPTNPQPLAPIPLVAAVEAVGMTVWDMDRSVEFYANVLSFEKVSDVEVWGTDYERLQGVFGLRMRSEC